MLPSAPATTVTTSSTAATTTGADERRPGWRGVALVHPRLGLLALFAEWPPMG